MLLVRSSKVIQKVILQTLFAYQYLCLDLLSPRKNFAIINFSHSLSYLCFYQTIHRVDDHIESKNLVLGEHTLLCVVLL